MIPYKMVWLKIILSLHCTDTAGIIRSNIYKSTKPGSFICSLSAADSMKTSIASQVTQTPTCSIWYCITDMETCAWGQRDYMNKLSHTHVGWVCVRLFLKLGKVPVKVIDHEHQQHVKLLRPNNNNKMQ